MTKGERTMFGHVDLMTNGLGTWACAVYENEADVTQVDDPLEAHEGWESLWQDDGGEG
jgi:hypothetical protein